MIKQQYIWAVIISPKRHGEENLKMNIKYQIWKLGFYGDLKKDLKKKNNNSLMIQNFH